VEKVSYITKCTVSIENEEVDAFTGNTILVNTVYTKPWTAHTKNALKIFLSKTREGVYSKIRMETMTEIGKKLKKSGFRGLFLPLERGIPPVRRVFMSEFRKFGSTLSNIRTLMGIQQFIIFLQITLLSETKMVELMLYNQVNDILQKHME
jgi:hypothetical protein